MTAAELRRYHLVKLALAGEVTIELTRLRRDRLRTEMYIFPLLSRLCGIFKGSALLARERPREHERWEANRNMQI